jgi:amino-acid N-acetyltransferase
MSTGPDFMQEPISIQPARETDLDAVLALLRKNDLPVDGVEEWLDRFQLAVAAGGIVGAAGYELHGGHALLRSVVVDPAYRGLGIGEQLVEAVMADMQRAAVRSIYLLTTTADDYFPRFGFAPTERAQVPAALHASAEFAHACPASARVMVRRMSRDD